jgi:hypothetical protein
VSRSHLPSLSSRYPDSPAAQFYANAHLIGVAPQILAVSPSSGPVGTTVTITGLDFGPTQAASTVTFNGTAGSPTSWSRLQIVVPVPVGATTGALRVTVDGQASNGVTFTVTTGSGALSGTFTHLSSVTFTGAGFGAHANYGGGQPFLNAAWNPFDVSLDAGNLARDSQVNAAIKWTLQTAGNRGGVATQHARKVLDPADTAGIGRLGSLEHIPSISAGTFYTSFWFRTGDPAVITSGKFYRQYFNTFDWWASNGANGSGADPGTLIGSGTHAGVGTIYGSTQGLGFDPGNTWRFMEFKEFLNGGTLAGYGSSDYLEWRVNNVRFNRRGSGLASNHIPIEGSAANENENWCSGANGEANGHTINIGAMINYGNGVDDTGNPAVSFYDYQGVYIDYTMARIMVGNASTFATCTAFELQQPTTWSDTSVTFRVNRGAFGVSANAWLYVVNSTEGVSAPQAVTFGTTY